jgi:transmembrane sensor
MDANERRERAAADAVRWWGLLGNCSPAEVSEADRRDFTEWLRESPLHIAEILRLSVVDDTLRHFEHWHELSYEAHSEPESNVVSFSASTPPAAPRDAQTRKTKLRRFSIAAAVGVIAVLAGWFGLHAGDTVLSTDRAERREVMLADGSVVSLEPQTRMRIALGKAERRIILQHGRALFHVAKDAKRPFLVASAGTLVRAVGTVFGVEEVDENTIVTVKEGKVAVIQTEPSAGVHSAFESEQPRAASAARRTEALLTRNEQLTVSAAGKASAVREVDAGRALAWSEGVLVFESVPLEAVVRRFNQYNHSQIRIRDPELARRTVSGVFQASEPETLIDFIRVAARVTVIRTAGEEIVISPSAPVEATSVH